MVRSSAMLPAELMLTLRAPPPSSPFEYHAHSARSLLMTHRSRPCAGRASIARRPSARRRGYVTEAFGLVDPLVKQQVDVLQEEPAASFERHCSGTSPAARAAAWAGSMDCGAHRVPRHPTDAAVHALDDLSRFNAVAAPKHRYRQRFSDVRDQIPVRQTGVRTLGRPPMDSDGGRPGSCTMRASSGALRERSFQPARIFTVTGMRTAFTIAPITAAACSGSRMRLQPALCFAIFWHGIPHVHVNDVGAHALNDLRGIGHLRWIATKDLNGHQTLGLGALCTRGCDRCRAPAPPTTPSR